VVAFSGSKAGKFFYREQTWTNVDKRGQQGFAGNDLNTKARWEGVPQGGTAKFMLCRVYTILPFYFFLRGSQNPFPDTGFRAAWFKVAKEW
jgi:hypothetical protein